MRSLRNKAFTSTAHSLEVARFLGVFRVFLVQTTLELVGKRTDLQDLPFEDERPRRILARFARLAAPPSDQPDAPSPADTQPVTAPTQR